MAEGIFNKLMESCKYTAFSRGLQAFGSHASENAIICADKLYGVNLKKHISKNITEDDIKEAILILTMTEQHKNILQNLFKEHTEKIFTLKEYCGKDNDHIDIDDDTDIQDPYGSDIDTYMDCAKEIGNCVEILIRCIISQQK